MRTLLRGGAYVTHDAGLNTRMSPLAGRSERSATLREAVEIWGVVYRGQNLASQSSGSESDAPHCEGLPVARHIYRRSGDLEAAPDGLHVEALNDQHAYIALTGGTELKLGDLLGCGISNPCCPGFQKWRVIPVVDDDYNVIDVMRSYP